MRIESGKWERDSQTLLYDIDIQLFEGEVTGLFADNIQTLDLLSDILIGRAQFQEGVITYKGQLLSMTGGLGPVRDRISGIDEHHQLIEGLSLAENLCILRGDVKRHLFWDDEILEETQRVLEALDLQKLGKKPVETFTELERLQTELLKAFMAEKEFILLDCRRIDLSNLELDLLFETVSRLTDRGIQFLVLENSAAHMLKCVSRIVLLKKRRTAVTLDLTLISEEKCLGMIKRVYGSESRELTALQHKENMECIFRVRGLWGEYIRDLEFQVMEKEITSVIIKDPRAYRELQEILHHRIQPLKGDILYRGRAFDAKDMEQAVNQGFCIVEGNPSDNNLFYNLSVFDNLCIVKGRFVKKLWRNRRYQESLTHFVIEHFGRDIGNRQLSELELSDIYKVMYYRWYLLHPKLVICIHPFGAADISTANVIQDILCDFAENDIAVLIITQNKMFVEGMDDKEIYVQSV